MMVEMEVAGQDVAVPKPLGEQPPHPAFHESAEDMTVSRTAKPVAVAVPVPVACVFYGWVILGVAIIMDSCTGPGHSTGSSPACAPTCATFERVSLSCPSQRRALAFVPLMTRTSPATSPDPYRPPNECMCWVLMLGVG